MSKWIAVCLLAFAVAKWSQNVQATDELNDDEKRLLLTLQGALDQDKRDFDPCDSDDCGIDCALECCSVVCKTDPHFEDCIEDCLTGNDEYKRVLKTLTDQANTNKGKSKAQKKLWRRRRSA